MFFGLINLILNARIITIIFINFEQYLLAMLLRIVAVLLATLLLPISMGHVYAEESCEGLAKVGDRVGIKFQVVNSQTKEQIYAAIVQIKNSDDRTVQLSWLVGIMEPQDKVDIVQSWVPEARGIYKAEVFSWSTIDNPSPLGPVREMSIVVNC